MLAMDTSKFKVLLMSVFLNNQKQIGLLRKYLNSKGFYDTSYMICYKIIFLDLKNQKNIEKFVKYFVSSFSRENFPITIIIDKINETIGTVTGSSFSIDSILALCFR